MSRYCQQVAEENMNVVLVPPGVGVGDGAHSAGPPTEPRQPLSDFQESVPSGVSGKRWASFRPPAVPWKLARRPSPALP